MLTEKNRQDRLSGIGASEIPSIVFPDQWGSPLSVYEAKVAPLPAPETTPDQERGEELEHAILKWTARRRRIIIEPNTDIVRHVSMPWCIATPDGFEVGLRDSEDSGASELCRAGVVEAKSPRRSTGWTDPDQDPTGIPRRYFVQVQWQLAATGLDRAILSALIHGDLWCYDIQADADLQAALLDAGAAFWRHVEAHDPPPPESPMDAAVLGRLFDQKQKDLVRPASVDEAVSIIRQFKDAQATQEEAESRANILKARAIAMIGEHAGLDLGDAGRVTYKRAKGPTVVDWQAVAKQLADMESMPQEQFKQIEEQYTTTKPGSRRFLASLKDEE